MAPAPGPWASLAWLARPLEVHLRLVLADPPAVTPFYARAAAHYGAGRQQHGHHGGSGPAGGRPGGVLGPREAGEVVVVMAEALAPVGSLAEYALTTTARLLGAKVAARRRAHERRKALRRLAADPGADPGARPGPGLTPSAPPQAAPQATRAANALVGIAVSCGGVGLSVAAFDLVLLRLAPASALYPDGPNGADSPGAVAGGPGGRD